MKKYMITLLLITLSISLSPLQAAEESTSPVPSSQNTVTDQENTQIDPTFSETPQEALADFSELMYAGTTRENHTKDLAQAMFFLEPHINTKTGKPENNNALLQKAKNLYLLIQSINYNPNEVEVTYTDNKQRARLILSDSAKNIELYMVNTPKYGWIFSEANFSEDATKAALAHVESVKANISKYLDEFVPELSSPLNTLYTFYYGIQGLYGYTMEDAVNALNLEDFDIKVSDGQGPTWAIQAYRMLRFASPISPESLPNDPNYNQNVVLLLDRRYGMMNMEVVTVPESGKKAWKIGYSGLNGLNDAYDEMMDNGMINQVGNMGVKHRTPHIILDDFFQTNLPLMELEIFGTNLWKITLTILLILSSLIIFPLTRIIFLPLINFTLNKLNISTSRDTNKRFILPVQICIVGLIWLYGIVIISANPKIMAFSLTALEVIMIITITLLLYRIVDSSTSIASDRVTTSLHIITSVLGKFLKIAILITAGLYLCSVFNINTANFLAALGIGGFAFALAGKDTMENFFGSIMIIIDRPFQNGDYIKINNIEGCIELVSVRSTRIRTFDDTIVTIPNRMFISSPVENLEIRKWRRYKTSFDILYETEIAKIESFTAGLTELAHLHPDVKKDAIQVYFYSLGSSSLQIFISLFFRNRGRVEELKARASFNTQAMKLAERLGIEFAYPTQKLFISNITDKPHTSLPTPAHAEGSTEEQQRHDSTVIAREISPFYIPEDKADGKDGSKS